MGGAHQPFLYQADQSSSRFPEKPFDPKAVTRASWEPKPVKAKQEGPLLDFNRHPDAHEIIGGRRKPYNTMSSRTKAWIKAMRVVQLLLRVLQLVGATGILVLVILINNIPGLTTWVMRVTAGFTIVHTTYGIYHLSRPAGYRTPASSSAYQAFSAFSDLCILPLYAYGALAAHNKSANWTTLLSNQDVVPYLITSFYYTLLGAAGLHLATLTIAFWLAIKFRKIAQMPPDMNPLEERYTTRSKKREEKAAKEQLKQLHIRSKSSIATTATYDTLESFNIDKGLLDRPPSVPFLHTRMGSQASIQSRDPRFTLPSQTNVTSSAGSPFVNMKRSSAMTTASNDRGDYAEIPLGDGGYSNAPGSRISYHGGRPGTGLTSGSDSTTMSNGDDGHGRQPKFTENWYASDSLTNVTQERNRAINTMILNASGKRRNYAAVSQAYDFHDSDAEDVSDSETMGHRPNFSPGKVNDENRRYDTSSYDHRSESSHPNPLRSNPLHSRLKTPYPGETSKANRPLSNAFSVAPSMTSSVHTSTTSSGSILAEVPLNDRRVSGRYTADIADATRDIHTESAATSPVKKNGRGLTASTLLPAAQIEPAAKVARQNTKRWTWAPRNRDSSIQPDEQFFSKPYGELKSATPPVIVGENTSSTKKATRQVSTGNDYDLGSDRYLYYGESSGMSNTFGRRNVSGKIAEEGRAYGRYSTKVDGISQ